MDTSKLVAILAVGLWALAWPAIALGQGAAPALELYSESGDPRGGFPVSRTRLASNDLMPHHMSGVKPARTSDGRLVTRVGVNAWFDGARVHVIAVLATPKDPGAEKPTPQDFTYAPLASFSLAVGEARSLTEMKKFGWSPLTVRIHPPGFKH